MSSEIAIKVENLSKSFQIYDQPRDRLKQFILPHARRLMGRNSRSYYREFDALKNVSFEVKRGETIGIIGRNGSGKSTLLQLICGTLTPTYGEIKLSGRVAALLELGAGFNPEFTGRENVYMNGVVLGLHREEIDERFADIAAFADIDDFIDQPVKSYSSGMYVRLAFAVAISVSPDILVIDEALSVGDEAFQRKCFSRIEAFKERGGTILFVSHSGSTIVELCDKALLLDNGEALLQGEPKLVVSRYQKLIYAPSEKHQTIREEIRAFRRADSSIAQKAADESKMTVMKKTSIEKMKSGYDPELLPKSIIRYESRGATISSPSIQTLSGQRVNLLISGETYLYSYKVQFGHSAFKVRFGMLLKTINGVELGGATTASCMAEAIEFIEKGETFNVEFHFRCLLAPGTYFLNAGVVGVVEGNEEYLDRIIDCQMIRVLPEGNSKVTGMIDFMISPSIYRLGENIEGRITKDV